MGISNPFRSSSSPEDESLIITHHYNPLSDTTSTTTTTGDHVQDSDTRAKATILFSTLFIFVGIVALATLVGRDPRFTKPDHQINNVVAPGVAEGVSKKSYGIPLGAETSQKNSWTKHTLAWQRTAFHFQPNKNWMNDPNGPLYYKGWYHLFYQYNPESAMWGNIVWGHAASTDLIHWIHLPTAMYPDQWYDSNGVWTGSTTKLPDGRLVVLYTGATDDFVQVQNLAYPANLSDPLLIDWVKYPGNPVIEPPQGVRDHDFRDPTTAWLTPQGKWRISIGSKHNRTGIALLYDTEDFKTFELLGQMLHGVSGTGMWECVDFYPVSKTKKVGLDTSENGDDVKHVVKTSLDDDRNDYYALGSYDDSGKWTPDDPKIDVGIGLRYDYGLFYASKTFFDDDKKRRVLWGWIPESDSVGADIKKGWASLQAVPRTVLYDKKTGSNLLQWPVEEIEKLRSKSWEFNHDLEPGCAVPLKVDDASQLDIVVELELDEESVKRANVETEPSDSCQGIGGGSSKRGALGPFGIMVSADKDLFEYTSLYFYISKSSNGDLNTFFCTDLTRSSEARDVLKPIYGSIVPVLKGEKLTMRILVDHSIVEGFGQGGRTCITSRVYPTRALYDNAQIFLFNNATDSNVSFSLNVWQMDSSVIPTSSSSRLPANLLSFFLLFVISSLFSFYFI